MSSETEPVAWLRAQITARLDVARKATPGPWEFEHDDEVFTVHDGEHGDLVGSTVAFTRHWADVNGEHIALNDPDDVIARCEAELAILDLHYILHRDDTNELYGEFSVTPHPGANRSDFGCVTCHYRGMGGVWGKGYCLTVSILAKGYRHRLGYAEAWPVKPG